MYFGFENSIKNPPLSIVIAIILILGLDLIGNLISKNKTISEIIQSVSNPIFQNVVISTNLLILVLFPIILFKFYSIFFLKFFSNIIFFFGLLRIIYLLIICKKIFSNFTSLRKKLPLIFILISYFILSLTPITNADSLGYHLFVGNHILQSGTYPTDSIYFMSKIAGSGEILIAMGLYLGTEQFMSILQFSGIFSLTGIFINLINKNKINILFFFLVITTPVVLFFATSSKPQLFHIASNILAFSILVFNKTSPNSNIFFFKFLFSSLLILISTQVKFSFNISLLAFLFYTLSLRNIKFVFLIIILFIFINSPILIWKILTFKSSILDSIFSPIPKNILGAQEFFNYLSGYGSNNKINIIFPRNISEYTQSLGLVCLIIFFVNKKIFLYQFQASITGIFFLIVSFYFGQFSSRFFLEPLLLLTIIICSTTPKFNNNFFFIIFKFLTFMQVALTIVIIWYFIFLINFNSFTVETRKNTMNSFAFGYSLYSWSNSILPDNSILLTTHGSVSLSKRKTIFPDSLEFINFNLLDEKTTMILEIKNIKPNFILLSGTDNNHLGIYKYCVGSLYSKKDDVNNYVTRNIFYPKKKDNGYIYEFLYYKLPYCLKR